MKSALPHNSWVLKHSIPHCGVGTSIELVQICVRVLKTRIPQCGVDSSTKIGTIKAAGLILRFHSVELTLPQRSLKSVGEFRTFDSTVWNRLFHKKRRNHKESSEPFFPQCSLLYKYSKSRVEYRSLWFGYSSKLAEIHRLIPTDSTQFLANLSASSKYLIAQNSARCFTWEG